jgi:hypothetical protein
VTSGRVVVVVGANVVVDVVVEVVVEVVVDVLVDVVVLEVVMTELIVDPATTVEATETPVTPCADPDEQAAIIRRRPAKPRATQVRRKVGISSKYPLRRTKCWRSPDYPTFSHSEPTRGCFAFSSERMGP